MVKREYLTSKEVEKMFGLAEDEAARLANKGKLPAYKVGKAWRFDIKELRAHCANSYPREGGVSAS